MYIYIETLRGVVLFFIDYMFTTTTTDDNNNNIIYNTGPTTSPENSYLYQHEIDMIIDNSINNVMGGIGNINNGIYNIYVVI